MPSPTRKIRATESAFYHTANCFNIDSCILYLNIFLLSIYIRYPFLNNTLLQAAAGHSLIGITPSSRTGAAYLRKFHYQKAVSSHKVPVTLPVIGYLSLVPLLQYPNWHSFAFNVRQLCATMSQSTRHRQSWRIHHTAPLFSASCRKNMKLSRYTCSETAKNRKGYFLPLTPS